MRAIRIFALLAPAVLAVAFAGAGARADTYPVSGKWTYENAAGEGPARQCGARYMHFLGVRRLDKGGPVADFRNVRVEQTGAKDFRLTDEFYNGQTRGRATFTLRIRDADRIELATAGKTFALRRCG
jgi:hypothetical protein